MDLLINLSLIIVPISSSGSSVSTNETQDPWIKPISDFKKYVGKGIDCHASCHEVGSCNYVTRDELEKLFVCMHQNLHQDYQNGQLVPI